MSNALGLKARAADRMESLFEWQPGANISLEGLDKTGKNHFAFTAPGPILCLSGDRRVDYIAAKQASELHKKIHAVRFKARIPLAADDEAIKKLCRPIWREVEELFLESLDSDKVRSIVVDTGTFFWELKRLAAFGKTNKVLPVFYSIANAQFERLLLAGEEYPNKHVIWLHKLGAEYKHNEPTGKLERKGFKNVGYDMQAVIRTGYDAESKRFFAKVVNNTFEPACNGMVFKGKSCNYATVMSTLTGSDRKEWS